jgi:SAM-dependent methyltransferase
MKRNCPICFSPDKHLLYRQVFGNKSISLMDQYEVMVCQKCGFVYADDIPTQAEFNKYYETMSKYEFNYSEGMVANDYNVHFQKIVDFIVPRLPDKNARILDIGCSTGSLLNLLKQAGYTNLFGIDPSPACVRTVRELYKIEASVNNIAGFESPQKADLIILSAVLEHFVDFTGSLQKIRALLKDQGLLFIEVPDAERFAEYIFTPFQQFSIEHINYFSRNSLANLLGSQQFDILAMQNSENRINQTIDPDFFVLSRRTEGRPYQMVRDESCEKRLKEYIAESAKMDQALRQLIARKLAAIDKFIIWGVGTHTQRLVGSGLDLSKVIYFVDSNERYRGKKISGIEVKTPAEIKENVPILISTFSYQEEVARQIKEQLKLPNEIIRLY